MPEMENTTEEQVTESPKEEVTESSEDKVDYKAQVEELQKRLSGKDKAFTELKAKLEEREKAEMSEIERLQKENAEFKLKESLYLKKDMLQEAGLSPKLASAISGQTPEEIEANIQALVEFQKEQASSKAKEDLEESKRTVSSSDDAPLTPQQRMEANLKNLRNRG